MSKQYTYKVVPHVRAAGSTYALKVVLKPAALPSSEMPRNTGPKAVLFIEAEFLDKVSISQKTEN